MSTPDNTGQPPAPSRIRRTARRTRTLALHARATAWRTVRLLGIEYAKGFAYKAGQLTATALVLVLFGKPVLGLLIN